MLKLIRLFPASAYVDVNGPETTAPVAIANAATRMILKVFDMFVSCLMSFSCTRPGGLVFRACIVLVAAVGEMVQRGLEKIQIRADKSLSLGNNEKKHCSFLWREHQMLIST